MVADCIKNITRYFGLGERIKTALEFLAASNFSTTAAGRYDVDGDNIFALVSEYQSKEEVVGRLEAHRNYIDVQFVVAGKERIGYSPLSYAEVIEEYDEEKDVAFYNNDVSFINMNKSTFAIFFPHDLHMPGIELGGKSGVKKVVVKVKV